MSPKEKARELVSKYYDLTDHVIWDQAKEAAIICVDEITDSIYWHDHETPNDQLDFWAKVKSEIQAL